MTSESANKVTKGSCLCGHTSWSTTETTLGKSRCYCRSCQKWAGSAFWAATGFPRESVTINRKIPAADLFSDMVHMASLFEIMKGKLAMRLRCIRCHSPVFMLYWKSHPGRVTVGLSTIDEVAEGTKWVEEGHIFVKEKPEWYQILDKLAQYDGFDSEFQEKIDKIGSS